MQLSTIIANKGSGVVTIQPDASVADAVAILAEHNIGALIVSADGRAITGILSERDIVRALTHAGETLELPVAAIMTSQVYSAAPDTHADELMRLMTQHRVRHVPVVDDEGKLAGLVSIGDVVKSRLDELETERAALVDYVTH